jgi:nucleoside-triphosphatase THEP1
MITRENVVIVITGDKGVGKSTLCRKVIQKIQSRGLTCGGIITFKAPDSGINIEDIKTGKLETLASVRKIYSGPRSGIYYFNPEGLRFGQEAIEQGASADILFVDELGHLEVRGEGFASALPLLNGRKQPTVVVIREELLPSLLPRFVVQPIVVHTTIANRDELPSSILERLFPGTTFGREN